MSVRKKLISAAAASVLMAFAIGTQPMTAVAQPQLTIQSEEAAHPRVVTAIVGLKNALRELQVTPDDFGGNKEAAMAQIRAAIHALKKALYYRLNMDDAAIDRVQ
jgi:hypothetical protein